MERFTKLYEESFENATEKKKKKYLLENKGDIKIEKTEEGYIGDAVDRLAIFENVYDSLVESQKKVIVDLDNLRKEGKTNTITFKQLMAKKLTNTNIFSLFDIYGLE